MGYSLRFLALDKEEPGPIGLWTYDEKEDAQGVSTVPSDISVHEDTYEMEFGSPWRHPSYSVWEDSMRATPQSNALWKKIVDASHVTIGPHNGAGIVCADEQWTKLVEDASKSTDDPRVQWLCAWWKHVANTYGRRGVFVCPGEFIRCTEDEQ